MTTAIAIGKLDLSPLNVRKAPPTKEAEAELLASIKHHDILENLVVVPSKKKGRFEVIAGGRRLRALLKLVESGDKKPTDTVNCLIKDTAEAAELSLIENTHRAAMHPADEFEAYAKLIKDESMTEKNIAERFGVTKKHVQQRLKLAQIHPEIITAFRANKISYDAVMGFTAAQSQEAQLAVWKELVEEESASDVDGDDIRREFSRDAVCPESAFAQFVGIKAYRAAGGTVTEDLFSDAKWLNDADLLEKLALEKLQAVADKLLAEGWQWAEAYLKKVPHNQIENLPRIQSVVPAELLKKQQKLQEQFELDEDEATEKALDAIESEIAEKTTYKAEDIAKAGCIIYVTYSGKMVVEKGLLRATDTEKQQQKITPAKATAASDDESASLPAKLAEELRDVRHQIAREQLLKHPELASQLLLYTICHQVLTAEYLLPLNIRGSETGSRLPELPEPDLCWIANDSDAATWQNFRSLSYQDIQELLAHCAARLLNVTLSTDLGKSEVTEAALSEININWHAHWQPTTENYFGRLKADALLALGESMFSAEWRAQHEKDKRPELAALLEEQLKATNWMPPGFAAQP